MSGQALGSSGNKISEQFLEKDPLIMISLSDASNSLSDNTVEKIKEAELDSNSNGSCSSSDDEPKPLEELGGIIVYDSMAFLVGCKKIEDYYDDEVTNSRRRMEPNLLFDQSEVE